MGDFARLRKNVATDISISYGRTFDFSFDSSSSTATGAWTR